jgi:hypothetical protein
MATLMKEFYNKLIPAEGIPTGYKINLLACTVGVNLAEPNYVLSSTYMVPPGFDEKDANHPFANFKWSNDKRNKRK